MTTVMSVPKMISLFHSSLNDRKHFNVLKALKLCCHIEITKHHYDILTLVCFVKLLFSFLISSTKLLCNNNDSIQEDHIVLASSDVTNVFVFHINNNNDP